MTEDTKPAAPTKAKRAKPAVKTPITAVAKAEKPNLPAIPKVQAIEDVKAALEVGASRLKDAAPKITDLVLSYAMDPTSEHHEWAAKLVAERLWPARGFAQPLVSQAGGVGGAGNSAPVVHINVVSATGPYHPQAAIEVKALEAIPDESEGSDDE